MKTRDLIRKSGVCVITAGLLLTTIAFADGIPEPGLVMYGTVTNTAGPFMLLSGSAQWTVFGSGSSAAVTPTAPPTKLKVRCGVMECQPEKLWEYHITELSISKSSERVCDTEVGLSMASFLAASIRA